MIITIAGDLGSGKSTIAKMISEKLGFKHYSTGDVMREMAYERGVSLLELTKMAETDSSIDLELDDRQKRLGVTEDNFVIDARLGWHFIPRSIKIYMKVRAEVAAERIMKRMKEQKGKLHANTESENKSFEDAYRNIKVRRESENKRFGSLYGLDQSNPLNYDLVIETSNKSPVEIVTEILEFIRKNNHL